MVRTYISPEYIYNNVYGTLNMEEESSFFGSKMLEIEDTIILKNENIVFYQNNKNEQLDLEKEYDFQPTIYDTDSDKQKNHILLLEEFQSEFDMKNNTRWKMTIYLKSLMRNYLFATLKKYRTFEGIDNTMTINQSVDFAIKDYIERNVINRYKFSGVDLFILPVDLLSNKTLKYTNNWDPTIGLDEYKLTKFTTQTDYRDEDVQIFFSQNFPSSQYSFRYYFNLKFDKA
jgi:hypothetical protein